MVRKPVTLIIWKHVFCMKLSFADIQAHAKAAVSNREALVKKIANQMHLRVSSDRAQHKRDLKQCKARIAEIEDLYAKSL